MRNFGEALKYQREINGYSQSSLAKATGLKQQMISWWEANKGLPNIDFCVQLANFYGITLEELLGLEDYPPEPKTSAVAPIHSADAGYTDEERALIEEYRKLPADSKKLILRMIGVTSDTQTTKKKA
ncbi:MAG: helix-turn-helix transcriptional regulator [Candidatus Coproplasma sp.]